MATTRPTKEAQDQYFRENGADPWGAETPLVRERQERSLTFIQSIFPRYWHGDFVEIGAFDGRFTRQLSAAFPHAAVHAADISRVAWEAAEAQSQLPPSVSFQWCDMADFRLPSASVEKPKALLLMECLYYLSDADQDEALGNLTKEVRPEMIFISGPIVGGVSSLNERALCGKLQAIGFRLDRVRVLTTNENFLNYASWSDDWLITSLTRIKWALGRLAYTLLRFRGLWLKAGKGILRERLDRNTKLRSIYARQVMYAFRRQ